MFVVAWTSFKNTSNEKTIAGAYKNMNIFTR